MQMQNLVGNEGADAFKSIIEKGQKADVGILASITGLITLLVGASGVFSEIRSALNKIWEVKPKVGTDVIELIRQNLFSFGMVLAIGFLLLVSLLLSAALAAIGTFWTALLPMPEWVMSGLNFLISFLTITALFALIFKYVPETKIAWKDVLAGSFFTAFLFVVGKTLIGLYLGKAAVGSAYGAAGSLIVLIVWVYYSAQIFFFGAAFTRSLATPEAQALPHSQLAR